jgi:hypothetical protein
MLDATKLTASEKRVLLGSLNGYCNRSVSWLQQTGYWTAKQAAEVQDAEHMIDVIEETTK